MDELTHEDLEYVEYMLKGQQSMLEALVGSHGPLWNAAQKMRDAIIEGRVQIVARAK